MLFAKAGVKYMEKKPCVDDSKSSKNKRDEFPNALNGKD